MVSQLAWLDHDDAQMRQTLAAIELFKEESTVDEIGIGSIRDTIADVLFPGTPSCTLELGTCSSSRGSSGAPRTSSCHRTARPRRCGVRKRG